MLNRVLAKGRKAIDGGAVVIHLKSATALAFVQFKFILFIFYYFFVQFKFNLSTCTLDTADLSPQETCSTIVILFSSFNFSFSTNFFPTVQDHAWVSNNK